MDPVTADGVSGTNFNRYWYANNNPYLSTDPDGRQTKKIHADDSDDEKARALQERQRPHAEITTYMNLGITTYRDSDGNSESYESRSDVSKRSAPGADDPYQSSDTYPVKGPLHNNAKAYGPNSAILTNDTRGRWLHGGGSGLANPSAPRQGWKPTLGCTRLQNEDIEKLAKEGLNNLL